MKYIATKAKKIKALVLFRKKKNVPLHRKTERGDAIEYCENSSVGRARPCHKKQERISDLGKKKT